MIILYEIPIILILMYLITIPIFGKIIINTIFQYFFYGILAIIIILCFISMISFVSKCNEDRKAKQENSFSFFCGIFFTIIFFPYLFLIGETLVLDEKGNCFLSFLGVSFENKCLFMLGLTALCFIIPFFIISVSKKKNAKYYASIIMSVILCSLYFNTMKICVNSYVNFENNIDIVLENKKMYTLSTDTKIYCSSGSPKTMYPLLSPIKLSVGEFKKGEIIYLISDNNALYYFDYVEVTNGKQSGYIKTKYIRSN